MKSSSLPGLPIDHSKQRLSGAEELSANHNECPVSVTPVPRSLTPPPKPDLLPYIPSRPKHQRLMKSLSSFIKYKETIAKREPHTPSKPPRPLRPKQRRVIDLRSFLKYKQGIGQPKPVTPPKRTQWPNPVPYDSLQTSSSYKSSDLEEEVDGNNYSMPSTGSLEAQYGIDMLCRSPKSDYY